ncbi:hypothetical protein [Azospirillum sp. ST 5-10]|uniref:hypothetical protein n=1 Tax=unclassified Azospirillum TaxID=2630922 RepID=UPI003F4A1EA3
MTKTAILAGALVLTASVPALAQSQGQLEAQQAPVERAAPEDTHGNGRSYSPAEKGVGEQHATPPGDALARPAEPGGTRPPSANDDDTAATSSKPAEDLLGGGRERPESAQQGPGDGTANRVDPGGRTPIRRAGEDVEKSWSDAEEK